MAKWTKAIFYKKIVEAVESGMLPSYVTGPEVRCKYRHPEGKKCVAGMALKNSSYTPDLEGYGIMGTRIKESDLKVKDLKLSDLAFLQASHDNWAHAHNAGDSIYAEEQCRWFLDKCRRVLLNGQDN